MCVVGDYEILLIERTETAKNPLHWFENAGFSVLVLTLGRAGAA